jgi:hypothetical protein
MITPHQAQGGSANAFTCLMISIRAAGISGHQRNPLAKLVSGKKYIVEGQRLEVKPIR